MDDEQTRGVIAHDGSAGLILSVMAPDVRIWHPSIGWLTPHNIQ